MGLKIDELNAAVVGEGCLGKAAPDEPVFILRAQDKLAGRLVRIWANWAEDNDCPPAKVKEARELAEAMENWPHRKCPD